MGKPAPVILIRDNGDDDGSTILGDEFDEGGNKNNNRRGSIASLRLPGIGGSSSASTSAQNAKGTNASSPSSTTSGGMSNSASIVQNASTDSAGIIGDDTSLSNTGNGGDDEKGGQGGGPSLAAFDFNFFLDQMRTKSAEPIAKYLRSFLREFNKKMWNVNDQIRVINDFLDVSPSFASEFVRPRPHLWSGRRLLPPPDLLD